MSQQDVSSGDAIFGLLQLGRRHQGRPRTCWREFIAYCILAGLETHQKAQKELEDADGKEEVYVTLLCRVQLQHGERTKDRFAFKLDLSFCDEF